jgi:thiol-disulfide isomerase/thioredoxin
MKKLLHSIAAIALMLNFAHAEDVDLSFAQEGNASRRGHLSGLQGTENPPVLQLANWENSSELNLEDLKGKIVILDFWATWCGVCIRQITVNNRIHEKYPDDVVIIGLCHPGGSEKMLKVMEEKGIKYPIAIDTGSKTIKSYNVDGYPDYYFIDRDGTLVLADCKTEEVEAVLEKLLKQQQDGDN